MKPQDRIELIRLASTLPKGDDLRRAVLSGLVRSGREFATQDAMKKYLHDHPDADPKNHSVVESEGSGSGGSSEAPGWGSKVKSLLGKIKGVKAEIGKALTEAPEKVQRMVLDTKARKEAMGTIASTLAEAPKKVMDKIKASAHAESHEIKHSLGAAKKLFKKPPGPFSKEDKAALYSAGAYVAGAALAAIPPGSALMAAGAVGKSFAMHVGIKALNEVMDKGFLHFEWAETLFHGAHSIMGSRTAADDLDPADYVEGLARVVGGILEDLDDDDVTEVLRGAKAE